MAPKVPEEIDVFTAPHSRMKELVNIYTRKMSCVDFRDVPEVVSLLQDLDTTLCEFKSHESIENIFIMEQLKNRLKQHHIYNAAVCDCHNDNQLSDVVKLVRRGTQVRERSVGERITFGLQLQRAFQDFVNTFLPHMEEEEQVFQPMLVEYFEYDELKVLKEIVLKEHEMAKDRRDVEKAQDRQEGQPETHASVKDLRDLDWDLCSLTEPQDKDKEKETESIPPPPLPPEPNATLDFDFTPPRTAVNDSRSLDSEAIRTHSLALETTTKVNRNPMQYHDDLNHAHSPALLETNRLSSDYDYFDDDHHHHLFPAPSNGNSSDYLYCYNNHQEDEETNRDPPLYNHSNNHRYIPSPDTLYHAPASSSPTFTTSIPSLPLDVLVEIFTYLSPNELCRCAQVCSEWNSAVYSPSLWSSLFPVQWARGIWVRRDVGLGDAFEDEAQQQQQQQRECGGRRKWDEDADVDEVEEGENEEAMQEYRVMESLVCWVLPHVGVGVSTLIVDAGRGITSRLLHQALLLCPNLTHLSASHTHIDSYTFKGLWHQGALHKLRHLDLKGCDMIDDAALQYLTLCVAGRAHTVPSQPCLEEVVVYEGCRRCGYSGPTWPNMPCQRRRGMEMRNQRAFGDVTSPHVDIEEVHCRRDPEWEVSGDYLPRSDVQSRGASLVLENAETGSLYLDSSQMDIEESYCPRGFDSDVRDWNSGWNTSPFYPDTRQDATNEYHAEFEMKKGSRGNQDKQYKNSTWTRSTSSLALQNMDQDQDSRHVTKDSLYRNPNQPYLNGSNRSHEDTKPNCRKYGIQTQNLHTVTKQASKHPSLVTYPNTHHNNKMNCTKFKATENNQYRNLQYQEDSVYRRSNKTSKPHLDYLNLSGCWRVTDVGLLALGTSLGRLSFLDVSGCYQLTGRGLQMVAQLCPSLPPEKLWYCDDILDGPFPATANGCANLANPGLACCRSGN